jgi:hypothetical protein
MKKKKRKVLVGKWINIESYVGVYDLGKTSFEKKFMDTAGQTGFH